MQNLQVANPCMVDGGGGLMNGRGVSTWYTGM